MVADYQFEVTLDFNGSIESQENVLFKVFGDPFQILEIKFVHDTPNYENLLFVYFQISQNLDTNSEFILEIPVLNKENVLTQELYDENGGFNYPDNSQLHCYLKKPTVLFVPNCYIKHG